MLAAHLMKRGLPVGVHHHADDFLSIRFVHVALALRDDFVVGRAQTPVPKTAGLIELEFHNVPPRKIQHLPV